MKCPNCKNEDFTVSRSHSMCTKCGAVIKTVTGKIVMLKGEVIA